RRGAVTGHVGGPEGDAAGVGRAGVQVRPARRAGVGGDRRPVDDGVVVGGAGVVVVAQRRLAPQVVLLDVRQDLEGPAGQLGRQVQCQWAGGALDGDRPVGLVPPAGPAGGEVAESVVVVVPGQADLFEVVLAL